MYEWQGVIPPVVTPLNPDGSVDFESYDNVLRHLIVNGVNGLFTLGSTGEVAYIGRDERIELIRRTVSGSNGLPVFAGCIDLTAKRCIEQAKDAQDAGADAVVITAPIYARNDHREIEEHFRMIARAIDIPVVAYDIPVRVHSKLSCESLVRLGAEGVIAGVKDSSGDDVSFRRLVSMNRAQGSPLRIFTGHEAVVDSVMLLGIDGVVPGLGNVDPAGYVRLWKFGQEKRWADAVAEQERLAQLFEIVFLTPMLSGDAAGVGAFKEAMFQLGIIHGPTMAPPTSSLPNEARERIAEILRDTDLLARQ